MITALYLALMLQTTDCYNNGAGVTCTTRADPVGTARPPIDYQRQQTKIDMTPLIEAARVRRSQKRVNESEAPSPEPATKPVVSDGAPTGREMYVSCYLASRNAYITEESSRSFGASICILSAGMAMHQFPVRNVEYCLPSNSEMRNSAVAAIANTYLDFYERDPTRFADKQGVHVLIAALSVKWPCKPK